MLRHARPPRISSASLAIGFTASPLPSTSSAAASSESSAALHSRSTLTDRRHSDRDYSETLLDDVEFQHDHIADEASFRISLQRTVQELRSNIISSNQNFERRMQGMEDKLGKVEVALQELTRTVQRISAQNYTTKGSVYESPLKVEVCQLFCQSLMREPSDESIRLAVTRVLTVEVVRNEKFKFDDALRFCKSRLADARTDERRKRLFIRHCDDDKQANHGEYRHWVQQYYSSMDEEQWDTVMQDDAAYNYALHGHGIQLPQ
ncbi:hypothetical protein EMCRGX_G017056 [Ephydatia muelleri]|eukprot:Em0006g395a